MSNKRICIESEVKDIQHGTQRFRIVLHNRFTNLSTHMETLCIPGFHHGHYFSGGTRKDFQQAIEDYQKRCAEKCLLDNLDAPANRAQIEEYANSLPVE